MTWVDPKLCPERLKTSLLAYRDERRPTGDFLRSVLENDLGTAVRRADDENVRLIPEILAFASEALPWVSRGLPERVRGWLHGHHLSEFPASAGPFSRLCATCGHAAPFHLPDEARHGDNRGKCSRCAGADLGEPACKRFIEAKEKR